MFNIEDIFKCSTLACTHAVTCTDEEGLSFTFSHFFDASFKFKACMDCVICSTYRNSMFAKSAFTVTKSRCCTKVQFWTCCINEVIISKFFALSLFSLSCIFNSNIRVVTLVISFRVNRDSFCLSKVNSGFFIHWSKRKDNILFCHFTYTYPDVGWNPVPL